jgi:2,4-dienoyl-CoA reductase-like NADH-dependent reductase (Old Yellow Enzyme family)/thioredoxin reductase
MSTKYPRVFSPFTIRGVLFKNRLEQSPPGCFFSGDDNGFVTDDFVSYFRQYARGGVAINSVGNCTIDVTESNDEPRQLRLDNPECVQQLKYFSEMCESYGSHGSLELTHNGKDTAYENINHAPYSASAFITPAERIRAEREGRDPIPTIEMSKKHIRETVEKYATAALYCKQAGMKMCMVHGAHGNLIAQFASSYYNKRADEYGGSLENRARFAAEVLDAVRTAVGENFVIEYRISAEEFHPEQTHFDETLEFIRLIKDKVDIMHVSAGIHDVWGEPYWMRFMLQNYTMNRQYNVHFAEKVKKAFPELIVATVGSIKDVAMAEEIIASGKADIVAMNRALHADYDMPRKYAEGREWEHTPCLRCRCFRMASPHTTRLCSVNAMWGRFKEYPDGKLPLASVKKKVAVVGGGPAGVESVKWLLQRGHDVTLYERGSRIGGHIRDAVAAPFKTDLKDYLQYMEDFAANCGAKILLNTEATPELLNAENYDYVIAALGAEPIIPKIPGYDKPFVHWAPDAENGLVDCGENVVIVGGAVLGTEASINLAMEGKKVTVIEMAKFVDLSNSGAASDLIDMSEENGVRRYLGWKLLEITDDGVIAENIDTGEKQEFKADTVLMAAGLKPRRDEALKFYNCCPATNFVIIGDCADTGDVRDAVWTAFEATRYI